MATMGWGAPEPHLAFQRARALCEEVGDQQQTFAALWGIWLFHAAGSDLENGLDLVGELFRIADTEKDEALELQAHHAVERINAGRQLPGSVIRRECQYKACARYSSLSA